MHLSTLSSFLLLVGLCSVLVSADNFELNGAQYFYGKEDKTWQEARDFCANYWGQGNGDLVSVDDENENTQLFEIIKNNGNHNTYIGGNDIATEGTWVWNDNCPFTFTKWHGGEPNNWNKEDCLHFWGNAEGTWNDIACGTKFWFMCERKRTNVKCGKPASLKWNDNEYYHGTVLSTWQEARTFCQGFWGAGNGDLVTVDDASENQYLFGIIQNNGKQNTWIGANDIVRENSFLWGDYCPAQFTQWGAGEPNNLNKEDCAHFWGDANGKWNDLACGAKLWFFCERKKTANANCGEVFQWNGSEYFLGKSGSTWQESRDFCKGFWGQGNGDLVTIDNANEDSQLYGIIKKSGNKNTYIGGNDINKEGSFVWEDKCPNAYSHWQQGEPNNWNKEDCAHFWDLADGKWNDIACASKFWFMCERKRTDLRCGLPIINWSGNEYYHGKQEATWQEARVFCQGLWGAGNGDLVTVNDAAENQYLYDNLVSNNGQQNTWIGANDIVSEGHFFWTNNCPAQFTQWHTGEPNNYNNEDCTHFWGQTGGTWNDLACGSKLWFICERKKANENCA